MVQAATQLLMDRTSFKSCKECIGTITFFFFCKLVGWFVLI